MRIFFTDIEKQHEELFIVGLWAKFEQFLREYLKEKGSVLRTQVEPEKLRSNLYEHYEKAVDYWKPEEILDFLKKSYSQEVSASQLFGEAKSFYKHRNSIAHGKETTENIRPGSVFRTLNGIIEILRRN